MKVISDIDELVGLLKSNDLKNGCLADTSFLYAVSYDDDKFHDQAIEIFEILAEKGIPIFANVISRLEFIDLLFRKQITYGSIELFNNLSPNDMEKY